MSRAGAPLRFLGLVLGGWMAVRTCMLWPSAAIEALAPAPVAPIARAAAAALRGPGPVAAAEPHVSRLIPLLPQEAATTGVRRFAPYLPHPVPVTPAAGETSRAAPAAAGARYAIALSSFVHYGEAAPPDRPAPSPSRLSASAWAIVRPPGTGGGAVVTPQLGGSQAGVRFAYALDAARRLAATLRIAGALGTPEREIAPGLEWRVPHTPLRLFAEQRIALARGRGGATVGAILGIGRALPARFELQAYAQGGVIARGGGEGFVDAAARVSRPMLRTRGVTLDVGLGSWGAAQRNAARLDAGPTIGASAPVGPVHLRLAADWRQRLAGDARPSSGPALSLGADF